MSTLEQLSQVTKLPVSDIKEIARQVKENAARLKGCIGPHDFQPIGERRLFDKQKCSKCAGVVDHHGAHWYKLGLEAR